MVCPLFWYQKEAEESGSNGSSLIKLACDRPVTSLVFKACNRLLTHLLDGDRPETSLSGQPMAGLWQASYKRLCEAISLFEACN